MRVSVFQMQSVHEKSDINLDKVQNAMMRASQNGSQLLVLPEFWATGYDLKNARSYATSVTEGVFASISTLAKKYDMAVVGSSPALRDERVYNTAVYHDRNGALLGRYDKIHLFTLMDENKYLAPGSDISVFDTEWGRVGLMICYDLRFPELMRRIALEGAQVVLIPAVWPKPRLEDWRLLLRARAVENQVFVVGCNRSREPGGKDFGYSAVVDPSGQIIAEAGLEEILMTADLDLNRVNEVRDRLPFFHDRREGFYGQF